MARVKTTRMVRIALWALRIYLIVLLSLIGLKFLRVSTGSVKSPVSQTPVPGQPVAPPK